MFSRPPSIAQKAHHPILVHEEDGAVRRRGRTPHADGLTRQASFAKELAGAQHLKQKIVPVQYRGVANLWA